MEVRVSVGVAVGGTVRVGKGVNVDVDSRVAVTGPGSDVVGFGVSVCLEVAEGVDVAVRPETVVRIGAGVLVEATGDGTLPAGAVGAKIWLARGSPKSADATVDEKRTNANTSHSQPAVI